MASETAAWNELVASNRRLVRCSRSLRRCHILEPDQMDCLCHADSTKAHVERVCGRGGLGASGLRAVLHTICFYHDSALHDVFITISQHQRNLYTQLRLCFRMTEPQ